MTAAMQFGSRWDAAKAFARRLVAAGELEASLTEVVDLQPAIDELVERGVLVTTAGKVKFFHQNFFDYVVGREFVEQGTSLVDYLEAAEDDLRVRAVVRRVLEYQRAEDHEAFVAASDELLNAPVRFLVKDVVFSLLQRDAHPSPRLWSTLRALILDRDAVGYEAAWSVVSQPSWVQWVDSSGELTRWMASKGETERDAAVMMLRSMQDFDAARVASLITPFVGVQDWNARLRWLMRFVTLHEDRTYFELVVTALRAGAFADEATGGDSTLWFAVHDLPDAHPDWAVELLDAYLQTEGSKRLLTTAQDRFGRRDRDHSTAAFVTQTATAAPRAFAVSVLPVVLEAIDATSAEPDPDGVRRDPLWGIQTVNERDAGFADALYDGLGSALRAIASDDAQSFLQFEAQLMRHVGFHSAAFLLFRAWTANPGQFWPQALLLITENEAVRRCGYIDSPYWVTRELIDACVPHANDASVKALQEALLSFYPPWERTPEGRQSLGHAQYVLLSALGDRATGPGLERLRELQNKFGEQSERPRGIIGGFVGPPIPEEAASKMTDSQWLRAIRKYGTDESRGSLLKGSAVELARVLQRQVQDEPSRFAALVQSFPNDVNEHYIDAVLRGLGESEQDVEAEDVFGVIRYAFSLPTKPGGRWIVRPLGRAGRTKAIPEDILQIVTWLATEHPDPEQDLAMLDAGSGGPYYGGDLVTAGINSVRGTAAQALAEILWSAPDFPPATAASLEKLVNDPVLAVRACAAWTVASVARIDLDLALHLFEQLARADDQLLASEPVERLVGSLARRRFDTLHDTLVRMLNSPVATVQRAGGRQAALARLANDKAEDLIEAAIRGEIEVRHGVAEVAAANVSNPDLREPCAAWLRRLFTDPDADVRESSTRWCWQLEGGDLRPLLDLARVYVDTPAHAEHEHALLHALEEAKDVPIADIALRAAEVFVRQHAAEISDISRAAAADAPIVSRLVFRAYASADTPEFRERCLDIIDQLLAARVRDVEQLVQQLDVPIL